MGGVSRRSAMRRCSVTRIWFIPVFHGGQAANEMLHSVTRKEWHSESSWREETVSFAKYVGYVTPPNQSPLLSRTRNRECSIVHLADRVGPKAVCSRRAFDAVGDSCCRPLLVLGNVPSRRLWPSRGTVHLDEERERV